MAPGSAPGEHGLGDFGLVGIDDGDGVHTVAAHVDFAAIGLGAEVAGRDGERHAHDGLAGGGVEDGEVAAGVTAGEELAAVALEADDGGRIFGGDDAVDGAGRERHERDGARGRGGDGRLALRADVEAIGGRVKVDAAARLEGIERDFDELLGIAQQHPERIIRRRERHGDGGLAGLRVAAERQRSGVEFVDGSGVRREDEGLGTGGDGRGERRQREDLRGRSRQRDGAHAAEPLQVDNRDRIAVAIGDEAVAAEPGGLVSATEGGGRGAEEKGAARDSKTRHFNHSTARDMLC